MRFKVLVAIYTVAAAGVLAILLSVLDWLISGEPFSPAMVALEFTEMLIIVSAMATSVIVINRLKTVERETEELRTQMGEAARAGADWRKKSRKLFGSLSAAILAQFEEWGLTEAEADIAGMILKGASLKQIAGARNTSEATIRQQAQGIYRKSGLANRAELSAYFLEDLFDIGAMEMAGPDNRTPPV